MKKIFSLLSIGLALPMVAFAAAPSSFLFAEEPLATSSAPGNSYLAGSSVVITAPTMGDLVAMGGSIVSAGKVSEDALFLGGVVNARAEIAGDLRAIGCRAVKIEESVARDLVALGYRVDVIDRVGGSVFIAGSNVSLMGGAGGTVIIYGNNVLIDGTFEGDVKVVAAGSVRLGSMARIRGDLTYEAPEPARIADTAVVEGKTEYSNAAYLPDPGTSRALVIASIGIFLLIRIVGALILAGLLAGLFPRLADAIVTRLTESKTRRVLLTTLLGFAVLVATPILLFLLAITFVGLGIALLLMVMYALLVMLSFMYAGITLGVYATRRFLEREVVVWHDGVLGMLMLSIIALIPIIGWVIVLLLMSFAAGALVAISFHAAFPGEE